MSLLYGFTGRSDVKLPGKLIVRRYPKRSPLFLVAHASVDPVPFELIIPSNYAVVPQHKWLKQLP